MDNRAPAVSPGSTIDEGRPPLFRTWGRMYLLVLGGLVAVIALFLLLTRIYDVP